MPETQLLSDGGLRACLKSFILVPLGLKLTATKVPLQVIVVDSAQKPTPNALGVTEAMAVEHQVVRTDRIPSEPWCSAYYKGLPLIFGPVHIAFMEMVIDPVCLLVFEAEGSESDVMKRPPRAATSPLFSPTLVAWGLLQGVIALVPLGFVYWLGISRGMPEGDARALTFVSLVLVDLALVLVNRSFAPLPFRTTGKGNPALWWVSSVTVALLAAVLTWRSGRDLFHFGPLHADDLALVATLVVSVVAVIEVLKRFWRQHLVF